MNELAIRFLERENCTLIIWKQNSYVEVDRIAFAAWQRSRLVGGASSPIDLTISEHIRNPITQRVAIAQRLLHLSRRLAAKTRRARARLSKPTSDPLFKSGDVLLIAWGVWFDQKYISEVERLQRLGITIVEIVYDMVPLVTPQYTSNVSEVFDRYARRVYATCQLILVISEHTRHDLKRWLASQSLPEPRIEVVRLGDDFQIARQKAPTDTRFTRSGLRGNDYILCVGTVEPRKNHTLLLYVYKLALQRGITLPKLVIVGRRGWMSENIYAMLMADPEIKDQFILEDNVSDEELSWFYQNCLFSIYPSFYEGWGLPVAESIAHGAPCIASDASSIPEIAGDLISYFSPVSTDECLAAIQHLLQSTELGEARQRIRTYQATAWDETFDSIDKQIKTLL